MDETAARPQPDAGVRIGPAAGPTGRYAPSPTGDLHLGNLRTALIAWALARRAGLGFVMRMEDLDERCRPEFVSSQLRTLASLGIDWDGPVVFQSERLEIYRDVFADLRSRGLLYECYCTRRDLAQVASAPHRPPGSYPGTCRDLTEAERQAGRRRLAPMQRGPAHRIRLDAGPIVVDDEVAGRYSGAVDDLVIRRGDGVFSYNFVSVLDDAAQSVGQVVRGDDLLPSTPRQIALQRVLGAATPVYAHVPMILNTAGVRLAKRDGAVTMQDLAEFGWKPADVVEFLTSSLGVRGVRSAREFADRLSFDVLRRGPTLIDPDVLKMGPKSEHSAIVKR
ncbi:MAG: tRNA glutamyl-Q(34) synthetase GluQRS [Actinomycetaceae bacterium]|nr:tRNA glutamyl-Q(34) synthetase GluQRS [Actinomycetaceae bacterium]